MQKCTMIGLMMILLLLLVPVKIPAEEAGHGSKEKELEHRHLIALFIGDTHEKEENGITVGLGYEYRLNELFGIGGVVEYAGVDFKELIVIAPLYLHPYKGWLFVVAPGVAIPKKHSVDVVKFLFRVGAAYEFEIGEKWALIPEFNVDFVDDREALVFGLAFGYEF